jgi:hypothetical protein
MSKFIIASLAVAACGFAGAASAAPLSPGSELSVGSSAENVRVVCRDRTVWRTNKYGERRRVTIRDCDRVGERYYDDYDDDYEPYRGPRYYHGGNYYRDPGFTIRIR